MGLITELIQKKILMDTQPIEKVSIQLGKDEMSQLKKGKTIMVNQNNSLYIMQIKADQLHKSQFTNDDYQIREVQK